MGLPFPQTRLLDDETRTRPAVPGRSPRLGPVYHVSSRAEMVKLLELQDGLAWTAHARSKSSSWTPDVYRDEDFFRSDRWLGAGWKAMPADLSELRLGRCGARLLDDMSNWGVSSRSWGEVDVFRPDHTHELYGHMNVNYVRLEKIPEFREGWRPLLESLRHRTVLRHHGRGLDSLVHSRRRSERQHHSSRSARRPVQGRARLRWTSPSALPS